MTILRLCTIFLLILFTQCISFSKFDPPKYKQESFSPSEKKIILLVYRQGSQVIDREKKEAEESNRKVSEERLIKILSTHPRVLSVVTDPKEKYDIKMEVDLDSQVVFYSTIPGAIATTLCYLTLTLFPSDIEQESKFTIQFSNEKTKQQLVVSKTAHFQSILWFFSIPLMPFYGLGQATDSAFLSVSHGAIEEAVEKQPKLF